MALRLHNTRSKRTEEFTPKEPGHVRMYVCGPSVYDLSHAGHARSYVFYDALKRYMKHKGLRVTHVQNFTDIEENIAKRSTEAGMKPLEYADKYIAAFFEDMDALGIQRADHYPRVSENIAEIQRIVDDLVEREIAYAVDCHPGRMDGELAEVCDVYFDVKKWPKFGELVGVDVDDLVVGNANEKGDRHHPLDFALWKSRDDWGIMWPSNFGDGRPGWHVECTAMAIKHLGKDFDLHGGGLDLVFPHHESEEAVGEAWTGTRYCNFYVHNGFVTVNNKKMGKSLGNFVTVRELRARHAPDVLRLFLLSSHYREAINFDEHGLAATEARLGRWKGAVAILRARAHGAAPSPALAAPICDSRSEFFAALDDDFHLERAVEAVDRAAAAAQVFAQHATAADAAHALTFFDEVRSILGVL